MSLDALLEPIPDRNKNNPCKVARLIQDLDDVYKTAALQMLDLSFMDGGLTDVEVADRFKRANLVVGVTTVNSHRQKRCSCE